MSLLSAGSARPRRPRRYVSPVLITALRPVFRHSPTRDAYVLRGIGNRYGPVLRPHEGRARSGSA